MQPNTRFVPLSYFARMIGRAYTTVYQWCKDGKLKCIRDKNGNLYVPEEEMARWFNILGLSKSEKPKVVLYARVSSPRQKEYGSLDRQIEELKQYAQLKDYQVIDIISDVGSGLKTNRKGLRKLFDLVAQRKIDKVVITYKDRLTRFGFEYLEFWFKQFGVNIEVIHNSDPKEKDYMEELVEDLIAIITHFVGKIYGKRSREAKKRRECFESCLK